MTALHERFGQIGNDMFRAAIAQRRNALVQRRNLRDAKRPHVVLLPGLEQHSSVAVDEVSSLSATSLVPGRLPASHPATVERGLEGRAFRARRPRDSSIMSPPSCKPSG